MTDATKKIRIKRDKEIKFPDVCSYCLSDDADITVPLSPPYENNHSDEIKHSNADKDMVVFAIPACSSCIISQRDRERQISNLAFTIFLVIFTGIASYLLDAYHYLFIAALMFFIIVLFASRKVIFRKRLMVCIDSVDDSSIVFNFNNKKYKDEFIHLNKELSMQDSKGDES